MTTVSSARFRAQLSEHLEHAQREPVFIMSRGVRRRAVLVSAHFYNRATDALGDAPYAPPPRTPQQEIIEETMRFIRDL